MRFEERKGLVGEVVLNKAGIFCGGILVYAEHFKKSREGTVTVVDALGNAFAGIGKTYVIENPVLSLLSFLLTILRA